MNHPHWHASITRRTDYQRRRRDQQRTDEIIAWIFFAIFIALLASLAASHHASLTH